MEVKEIKIYFNDNQKENKIIINLHQLEVLIDGTFYGLTNYESTYLYFDKDKKQVVGDNLISIMNGKEYILKPKDLFLGENLNFLLKKIEKVNIEKERKTTRVKTHEIKILIKEMEEFNRENIKKCLDNLLDISLVEKDKNLFDYVNKYL